ncbi:gp53-like domain-containing protein [Variovorax paradoxus]|uniref:gp53-like domain-containing protein n=1 Tax=Variovorax paradoxus TaxID=34073 RepID=UPI0028640FFD|nr:hypothetical protein [Variovorax paradoxus]MDR6455489.1 hypothetical protein [Variovorax paradoxus]
MTLTKADVTGTGLAKADLSLGNVDNTSDASKPISTATQTALNGKEPTIAAGTTSQFWRGDKTWADFATTVRAAVLTGLSTATSTAVAATDTVLAAIGKLQAQLNLKAALASPALTGTPTAPTQASADNTTAIATTGWVRSAMSNIASAAGFALAGGSVGYIKFPSWLGGMIIQFGTSVGTTNAASAYVISYPITFPNSVWTALCTNGDAGAQLGSPIVSNGGMQGSSLTVVWSFGQGGVGGGITTRTNWIVIGN